MGNQCLEKSHSSEGNLEVWTGERKDKIGNQVNAFFFNDRFPIYFYRCLVATSHPDLIGENKIPHPIGKEKIKKWLQRGGNKNTAKNQLPARNHFQRAKQPANSRHRKKKRKTNTSKKIFRFLCNRSGALTPSDPLYLTPPTPSPPPKYSPGIGLD